MSINFYHQLCVILKIARVRMNLTQAQVADKTGVSQASISRIESFKNGTDVQNLVKLMGFYKFEVSVRDPNSRIVIKM